MKKSWKVRNFFAVIATIGLLPGCIDPTSAVTTTAGVIYERNSWKKTLDDTQISAQAYQKIYVYNNRYKDTNVSISTFNNTVLMVGQTPTSRERAEIEQLVRSIKGTFELHNLITVSPSSSVLTQASDAWITAKVKAKLIASNEIDPSKIKVITENGTVYLMGIVMRDQAEEAVEIARTTAGVQSVVKVFSYLTISKT